MPHGLAALVIRFSSLGDALLAAHLPSFLREADPGRRVLFMTKERYAHLLRGHPHVARFYALQDRSSDPMAPAPLGVRGALGDLIAALRHEEVREIYDLHQNLRSARVVGAFPEARRVLPPKYALRRRLRVYARWLKPPAVPPLLRTYREIGGLAPAGSPAPWLRQALSQRELERGAEQVGSIGLAKGFVFLGIGARWETKRWPAQHFVALAEAIGRELGLEARYAASPEDPAAVEVLRILPAARRAELVAVPFREVMAVAAHARAIVSNDSAVLHLGPALGVPSVGVFGSTVPEFGFARQGVCDDVAEIELPCRPCDVHGKSRCPLGHHACMRDLLPRLALEALARVLARSPVQPAAQASRA